MRRFISYTKIVQIFQKAYLGSRGKRSGLYLKERPLLSTSLFQKLLKKGLKLGIATGRNRFETLLVLRRFGWLRFFKSILTADEVTPSLSKPHPYALLESAKKLGAKKIIYVGDLPDDMKAARLANQKGITVRGIGYLKGVKEKTLMRQQLLKAGAALLVKNERELQLTLEKLLQV